MAKTYTIDDVERILGDRYAYEDNNIIIKKPLGDTIVGKVRDGRVDVIHSEIYCVEDIEDELILAEELKEANIPYREVLSRGDMEILVTSIGEAKKDFRRTAKETVRRFSDLAERIEDMEVD